MKYTKKKVYRKKRRYNRKKKGGKSKLFRNSLLPTRYLGKMSYVESVTLDPAVVGTASLLYRANDLFDPTFSAGGHQPLGFDQMMALYQKFHVIGAKITARFASADTTSNLSTAIVGVHTTSQPTAIGIDTAVLEQPGTSWKYVQLGANIATCSNKYSVKKSQGVKNVLDNYELAGNVSQSPTVIDYFRVFVQSATPSDSAPVRITIKIDYIAIFSDPVQQQSS